jgi:hypothetical protein
MARNIDRIFMALQECGMFASLKVDHGLDAGEKGLTAWIEDFANDRRESVTWMGRIDAGDLQWPTSKEICSWLLETALRVQREGAASFDDGAHAEANLLNRLSEIDADPPRVQRPPR